MSNVVPLFKSKQKFSFSFERDGDNLLAFFNENVEKYNLYGHACVPKIFLLPNGPEVIDNFMPEGEHTPYFAFVNSETHEIRFFDACNIVLEMRKRGALDE